ncbi:unnamed protein product, partial [Laminaria digitata]
FRTSRPSALFFSQFFASAAARTITVKAGEDFEAVCLHVVQPGDTCYLEKGNYKHDGLTVTHGKKDKRITITGHSEACIRGSNTQDRVLQIAHDYYTIEGICFNGQHGSEYCATAIYVLGEDKKSTKNGVKSSVTGLQLFNLEIKNFDSECIHFRYFVTHAEVQGCTIQKCGREDFERGGGGRVGEGIYLGTALDQVDDNKAPEIKLRSGKADNVNADVCRSNWIHHNTFRTYGNECVDVKEGSTDNLIEYNVCEKQKDTNSGGFGLRGSGNTVRYNDIAECVGAGVRVGGDKGYGKKNNIYGNGIKNTRKGAFNVMQPDQGVVCENDVSGTTLVVGAYSDEHDFEAENALGSCSSKPGSLSGFDSSDSDSDSDSKDDDKVGVNGADNASDSEELFAVESNDGSGSSGLGGCETVLKVAEVEVKHIEKMDSDTSVDNLFDSKISSYFSVNRESTSITLELEKETEIDGVSIGFFMKAASEERITTFDISVRSADGDWTTVISRKESSGEYKVVESFPFSTIKALYVRFESHGNTYNNWTALTEFEVCGADSQESNALFGGAAKAAAKEIQMLAGQVCARPSKLAPTSVRIDGDDNVSVLFDGNFQTRWSTVNTANKSDHNNDKIIMRFLGDQRVSRVKIAFFDGDLARPHFSLYKQSAVERVWTEILDNQIGARTEAFQTFDIEQSGVNHLYIVGNGNDIGLYTKISEVEVWGC